MSSDLITMFGGFRSTARVLSRALHGNPTHTKEEFLHGNDILLFFRMPLVNKNSYVEFLMPLHG